jgi:hypothetical protein
MSTPHQGPVGTGGSDEPSEPNAVAEHRARAAARVAADVPPNSVLLTSRTPEPAPYNIVIDMNNILTGGRTTSGFIIWYCPNDLVERLKRHMLVIGGRVVLSESEEDDGSVEEVSEPEPEKKKEPAKKGA